MVLEFFEDLSLIPERNKGPLVPVFKKDVRTEYLPRRFVILPPFEIRILHLHPDLRGEDHFDHIPRDGAGLVIDLNG